MKNTEFILSIDIGTSSTKAILVTTDGEIIYSTSEPYRVIFGDNGKVEQDPEEIYLKVITLIKRTLIDNNIKQNNLIGIILDGILHSLIPIDKNDNILTPASLWADTRSLEQSSKLRNILNNEEIKSKTGCSIHPIYFPSRLLWLKENDKSTFNRSYKFISIKEYIIKKLTGEYIIDKSTASGTGLLNIHTGEWDNELLSLIKINKNKFSEIKEPTHILKVSGFSSYSFLNQLNGVPLVIGSSDGPMAHFGSSGLDSNKLSLTIGSSCAMRRLLKRPEVIEGKEAWCYYMADGNWLLGGVAHDGGIIFQWLNENIFSIKDNNKIDLKDLNDLVKDVPPGSNGLFFLPYLSGERTPNYNPKARGVILGLSYNHSWRHILRSAMEGISYRLSTIYDMLSYGKEYDIVLTGGIIHIPIWIEVIAGFLNKKLFMPEIKLSSAWGSYLLALKSFNITDLNNISNLIKYKTKIIPDKKLVHEYNKLKSLYYSYYYSLFY